MRLLHAWKSVRRLFRTGRSRQRRRVLADIDRLDDYILRDIGLEQHPESRAEAWWRREIPPRPEIENLRK